MANKLMTALTQNGNAIKATRAQVIAEDMESAQSKLVQKLKDEKRSIERNLMSLSDFYPDSELSLRVVKDSFDANKWAHDTQNLEVSLLNKTVELKAAQATYDKWFKEEADEPVQTVSK